MKLQAIAILTFLTFATEIYTLSLHDALPIYGTIGIDTGMG